MAQRARPPDAESDAEKVEELNEFLYRAGLLERGQGAVWTALPGGVSSEIWRVDLPGQTVCVKRALARLKVRDVWRAPTERSLYEWEWFRFVDRNFPGVVPRPLARDAEMRVLAMEFLPPEDHPVWKEQLLRGVTDARFARRAGELLGKIHARSASDREAARTFQTDHLFRALRVEPYLLATAARHPELARQIESTAEKTLSAKIALVHGDVSPKNILVGKKHPVFLDAETAWFGDPAFDLAFCLNHFLLKRDFSPASAAGFMNCFNAFAGGYLSQVVWEEPADVEARAARLLPMLYLARVDGKSPAEYITDEETKNGIRRRARALILNPVSRLKELVRRADSPG